MSGESTKSSRPNPPDPSASDDGRLERAFEAPARLSGRDGEAAAAPMKVFQHLAHAAEKGRLGLPGEEVMAVTLREPRLPGRVQIGHHFPERVRHVEADHEQCFLFRGDRASHVAASGLEAVGDHARGVHERAVPVEDDQVVLVHAKPLEHG